MADLDLDAIAAIEVEWDGYADYAWVALTVPERDALVAEVRRLRAENAALAAALEDIAGMWQRPDGAWVAMAECSHLTAFTCIEKHPDDPGEWCPVCVAEVAWCAWRMGVLT